VERKMRDKGPRDEVGGDEKYIQMEEVKGK
jgi:hypothetical protein